MTPPAFSACAARLIHDHGAYTARGVNLPYESAQTVTLPYEVPAYRLDVKLALTNKVPVSPVRGAGQPQGVFVMERLLDRVARELGLDRAEVRRRNLIGRRAHAVHQAAEGARRARRRARQRRLSEVPGTWRSRARAGTRFPRASMPRARRAAFSASASPISSRAPGRGPFESVTRARRTVGHGPCRLGRRGDGPGHQDHAGADRRRLRLAATRPRSRVTAGDTAAIALGIGGFNSRQAVLAGASAHLAALAVRDKALADRRASARSGGRAIWNSPTARCASRPRRR